MLLRNVKKASLTLAFVLSATSSLASDLSQQADSYRIQSLAGIQEGTYEAENVRSTNLYIKKELSEKAVNFYALLSVDKGRQTALFKIDQIDAATLSFVNIQMGKSNILSANKDMQPSYSGTVVSDRKGNQQLILQATNTGVQQGCPRVMRFELDKDPDESWVSLSQIPANKLRINKDTMIDLALASNGKIKQHVLNLYGGDDITGAWAGQYLIREQIAGVGLARQRSLDSMSASGFSLTRHAKSVVMSLKTDGGQPNLQFVMMRAGSNQCLSKSFKLK